MELGACAVDAHQNGPGSARTYGPGKVRRVEYGRGSRRSRNQLASNIVVMRRVAHRAGDVPLPVLRALRPVGWTATCAPAGRGARVGQAGAPQQPCNPYFGSTPPELTSAPTAEQRSRRAQRRCKDGAQRHPQGSSLTGASTMAASGGSGPPRAPQQPGCRTGGLIRSPTRHSRCAPAAGRVRTRRARRL